jgi:uncharacterized protein YndB with AHSA1/START domain
MPAAHATAILTDENNRAVLRFERRLPHSPERVWRALTETTELAAWHPTPFELDHVVGGSVRFRTELGGPPMPVGELLAYEPPHELAYTWGEDELRFTVTDAAEGCLLVLEHTFEDRFKAARDAAGWELCLQALDGALAGDPARQTADEGRLPGGWAQLNAAYEQRFGIAPGQATPPPSQEELAAWKSGRDAP